jgi:hypothetical protein
LYGSLACKTRYLLIPYLARLHRARASDVTVVPAVPGAQNPNSTVQNSSSFVATEHSQRSIPHLDATIFAAEQTHITPQCGTTKTTTHMGPLRAMIVTLQMLPG